jgi:DNA mismatch endonuclease, patch repair protein
MESVRNLAHEERRKRSISSRFWPASPTALSGRNRSLFDLPCSRIDKRSGLEEMDIVSRSRRSAMMANIGSKDTTPELRVRRTAHSLGYRYVLHARHLPGSPDLVFPRLKRVILVHGCYWHRHAGCRYAYNPKSNMDFWQKKFTENVERDARVLTKLAGNGWLPLVIWECETKDLQSLRAKIAQHLGSGEE